MKNSFLAVGYCSLVVVMSGALTALTLEVHLLFVCFLLGGLTSGPPWEDVPNEICSLS